MPSNKNPLRYGKISLHYISLRDDLAEFFYGDPASYTPDNTEALDCWRTPSRCELGLCFRLNGSVIWSTCNLKTLAEIALRQPDDTDGICDPARNGDDGMADYWPFVCPACGIPECAGVFQPLKVSRFGDDIILGLPKPFGKVPPERVIFRKYRLHRRDFLDAMIDVVKFRLAFEDMMLRSTGRQGDCELGSGDVSWLTAVFGVHDGGDYQLRISQWLRKSYSHLLESRQNIKSS